MITAKSIGYGANNIMSRTVIDDVTMALDNLASVALSKTDTINTLAAANKQLAEMLANIKENEKLLSMVNQLTTEATEPKP